MASAESGTAIATFVASAAPIAKSPPKKICAFQPPERMPAVQVTMSALPKRSPTSAGVQPNCRVKWLGIYAVTPFHTKLAKLNPRTSPPQPPRYCFIYVNTCQRRRLREGLRAILCACPHSSFERALPSCSMEEAKNATTISVPVRAIVSSALSRAVAVLNRRRFNSCSQRIESRGQHLCREQACFGKG